MKKDKREKEKERHAKVAIWHASRHARLCAKSGGNFFRTFCLSRAKRVHTYYIRIKQEKNQPFFRSDFFFSIQRSRNGLSCVMRWELFLHTAVIIVVVSCYIRFYANLLRFNVSCASKISIFALLNGFISTQGRVPRVRKVYCVLLFSKMSLRATILYIGFLRGKAGDRITSKHYFPMQSKLIIKLTRREEKKEAAYYINF